VRVKLQLLRLVQTGVVGSVVLSGVPLEALAQPATATPPSAGGSVTLPSIAVQHRKPVRKRTPAPARSSAQPASVPAGERTAPRESAWGHVNGVVATRSGSATKTDTPLIETPAAVSVVTQDQIQAQAAQNISQATRYTPGVRAEFAGADARTDTIYIRGFPADVYLDSVRVLNFGIFAYALPEPFNLERAEILHGPASILFGQASPGGVVNLVSKRPTVDPYHEMFLSTGSYGRIQGGIDLSGPIDKDKKWLYRFTASGFDVGTQVDQTKYQRVSIQPAITWRPDNDTSLTVLANYQKDPNAGFYNQLLANGVGTITPYKGAFIPTSFYSGEPNFDKTDREYSSIGYLFERRVFDWLSVRQNLRYTSIDTDFAVVSPDSGQSDPTNIKRSAFTTVEKIRSFAVDSQAEAKFATGPVEHTVLAGIDYRNGSDNAINGTRTGLPTINAFNPVYGAAISPIPLTTNNRQNIEQVGGYLQDQLKLGRWVALLGIRDDLATSQTDSLAFSTGVTTHTEKSDTAVSKRGALLYKFDNGVAPYVQYTESFQPAVGTDFFGQPFKPTRGEQKEAGIKYQPNDKSLFTVAAFDLRQQNVLTQDLVHAGAFRVQTGEIKSQGVEFEGKTVIDRDLTVIAAYTYLNNVTTQSNTPTAVGQHPVGFPRHSAAVWADYTFHRGPLDGFGLAGGVRHLSELPGNTTNTFYVPSVTLFDAAVHYDFAGLDPRFKGYSFQLNATNLFDKTYVTYCQDIGCYYGLRRAVIATLRYKW
jgi:iron complex outermembrane receptor protein